MNDDDPSSLTKLALAHSFKLTSRLGGILRDLSFLSMTANICVLGLILSFPPYLRVALGQFLFYILLKNLQAVPKKSLFFSQSACRTDFFWDTLYLVRLNHLGILLCQINHDGVFRAALSSFEKIC